MKGSSDHQIFFFAVKSQTLESQKNIFLNLFEGVSTVDILMLQKNAFLWLECLDFDGEEKILVVTTTYHVCL